MTKLGRIWGCDTSPSRAIPKSGMVIPRRRGVVLGGALILVLTILFLATQGGQQKDRTSSGSKKRQSKHPGQEEYVDRRGIRVIVGHYKGDEGPGPNLTQQELNANNFKPEVVITFCPCHCPSWFSYWSILCSGRGRRGRSASQFAASPNNPRQEAFPHQPVQHLGLGQDKPWSTSGRCSVSGMPGAQLLKPSVHLHHCCLP